VPDAVIPATLPDAYLAKVESEILAGLPNEQERRAQCLRNMDYYHLRGAKLIPRRDAETDQDYRIRPKRHLPFTSRVIRVLASKLYAPGPSRTVDEDDAATAWLDLVYGQNLINSLWQRADRMSMLNGMSAFQVSAGGDPSNPIKIQLWAGWHEVVPFEHPEDANTVGCVVTVDCVDQRTRYTWWTNEFFRVYETEKLVPGQTSGGRVSHFVPEESGVNPYGVIPFAFVWYELPTNGLDSVEGLGPFLESLNSTMDVEVSDMAQAVQNYHSPIPVAYDADIGWAPIVASGKWMRVNSVPTDLTAGPPPKLEYLQAALDIAGGWLNINNVVDSELEGLGIPLTAYRMNSATLPSGAALMAEQKPLTDYALERREPFRNYETALAKIVLKVGGEYYGRPDLVASSSGPTLNLSWPPLNIDLPGPDRDAGDNDSLAMGLESRVMIAMRRFGMTRKQALQHLKQAMDDENELIALGGAPPAVQGRWMQIQAEPAAADAAPAGVAKSDNQPPDPDEGTH
jgi:hypothetical protein